MNNDRIIITCYGVGFQDINEYFSNYCMNQVKYTTGYTQTHSNQKKNNLKIA